MLDFATSSMRMGGNEEEPTIVADAQSEYLNHTSIVLHLLKMSLSENEKNLRYLATLYK